MAFKAHAATVLLEVDPEVAWKTILRAFVKANGSRTKAAFLLGCSRSTFYRWVERLGAEEKLRTVEKILKRDGLHHGRLGGAGWHSKRRASGTSDPF